MKKIKIVVDDLSIKGGVESVVTSVANGIKKKGADVTIICVKHCISAYHVDQDLKVRYLVTHWSKLNKYRALIRYFKKDVSNDDVLYTNSVANTILAILFAPKSTAIYACDHNKYSAVKKIWSVLRAILYKKLSGIVVLTQHDLEKYSKINSNAKVFDNPVAGCFFNVKNRSANKEPKYILNVGRLEIQKGQDLLLTAWASVNKKGCELWICGEGTQKNNLQQQVELLNLESSVRFMGNRNDIDSLLGNALCNVLSSRFEGKPVSLIESKVAGCPNVSFDCKTGPSEIINDHYDGLLIPAEDTQKLAQGIQQLIDNPEFRNELSKNSLLNNKRYSIDSVCEEYLRFFKVKE